MPPFHERMKAVGQSEEAHEQEKGEKTSRLEEQERLEREERERGREGKRSELLRIIQGQEFQEALEAYFSAFGQAKELEPVSTEYFSDEDSFGFLVTLVMGYTDERTTYPFQGLDLLPTDQPEQAIPSHPITLDIEVIWREKEEKTYKEKYQIGTPTTGYSYSYREAGKNRQSGLAFEVKIPGYYKEVVFYSFDDFLNFLAFAITKEIPIHPENCHEDDIRKRNSVLLEYLKTKAV